MHIDNTTSDSGQKISVEPVTPKITLSYTPKVKMSLLPTVHQSSDAYRLFIHCWDKEQIHYVEEFKVMLLSRASRVLGICTLTRGTAFATLIDIRNLFACALLANACSVICCHNHPAGSLQPSHTDEEISRKLKEGGRLLDIQVIDHLIISPEGYYSFGDEGIL
jgi:DNA repair protein RadC